MEVVYGPYTISDDKSRLDVDAVCAFLARSYWANQRPEERTRMAIEHSLCFGMYEQERLVGFARVVTDGATIFYLCDVFIDEAYRGQGLGKLLVETVLQAPELAGINGLLGTRDAHTLYERYGFERDPDRFMRRPAAAKL
ncbi:GNAT family N-acetyltransferase [Paenibacillus filicis]|uniref:GNAT family N-acetyltransferase n=1 Tax=Paenibacillus filicis TaxID=669464 RepID=A0ABU9DV53_9BACL